MELEKLTVNIMNSTGGGGDTMISIVFTKDVFFFLFAYIFVVFWIFSLPFYCYRLLLKAFQKKKLLV